MTRPSSLLHATAAFVLVLLCMTCNPLAAKTPGEVEIGAVLREAQMQGLLGPNRKLSDYRGKALVINVWASWCGPCRQEMGSIERMSRRDGGVHFNVIGVSTDDYVDKAQVFLEKTKITFSNFIDHDLILENMLGADHLPLTLLVDANGRVLEKVYGSREWDSAATTAAVAAAPATTSTAVRAAVTTVAAVATMAGAVTTATGIVQPSGSAVKRAAGKIAAAVHRTVATLVLALPAHGVAMRHITKAVGYVELGIEHKQQR
jgi:thiol-disulfide isomerase/thioredoxin